MTHCLLIADDLTGACDAAVQFAMRGFRTVVSLSSDYCAAGTDVLAISTESREAEPGEFRRRLEERVGQLQSLHARILFKKIDSMLRGNAAEEIRALVELFGCDAAVITPAFPAMRRTVEEGFLHAGGIAGFEPISLADYCRQRGLEPCAHARPGAIQAAINAGARFITVDAVCDLDLDEIVAEALCSDHRILWAGSAGLASALARTVAQTDLIRIPPIALSGPLLFCIGSDHPVTVEQLRRLRAERQALVLEIPWGRITAAQIHERLANARASIGALVISGGETASLVCRALGVRHIDLQDEIAAGIPLGCLRGGPFDGVPVATKSGAFGDSGALIRINDYFLCLKS